MKKLTFLLTAIWLLSGCQKDDDADKISSVEAQAAIESMTVDMESDIIDLVQSEGIENLSALFDLTSVSTEFSDISVRQEDIKFRAVRMAKIFASTPNTRVSNESSNDFIKGVYAWDVAEQDFIFIESSNNLELRFPSAGSETNNAIFILSQLAFDINELPTAIEAQLHVDEVLMVDLSLTANWSSDGLPESANISLFVKPFTFALSFDNTADTQSSLYASIEKSDELIASIELLVKYSTAAKEFPKHIAGTITYRGIAVKGEIDIQAALTSQSGNPNDFITIKVFSNDVKIGNVVFVEEEYEEDGYTSFGYVPYLKYNDGTKISLEDLFEDMFLSLEEDLAAI